MGAVRTPYSFLLFLVGADERGGDRIETRVGLWRKGTESEAWLEGADWVVDAIDNINTKVRSWDLTIRMEADAQW